MHKGFTLLETLIAITFLSVALLLFYNTFFNLATSNQQNILYDDTPNIYKTFFLNEYLQIKNYDELLSSDITELSCDKINIEGCQDIIEELNINKMYLAKYNLKEIDENKYNPALNKYLKSLSYNKKYAYRFITEYKNHETYAYASLDLEVAPWIKKG